MEFTEEEKSEFSLRIQQNSDLLTTLVDDLLDLASWKAVNIPCVWNLTVVMPFVNLPLLP